MTHGAPMTQRLSLKDLPINGKKVLMRVDFNVPQNPNGEITDDTRIRAALPSIKYVIDHEGSVVLMSHLGRPKSKPAREFSLAPIAQRLSKLLNKDVIMAPDCIGPETEKLVHNLKPGQILLLENLRFHSYEENPEQDPSFAKKLSQYGDYYVNDAFGTAHRSHSSTATVAQYFPGKCAAGFLMQKEIDFLGDTLLNPEHPFAALIGGAKISSKLGVIKSLIHKVDALLVGGGMAYTFLKAQGKSIGNSIHEDGSLNDARKIMEECKSLGVKFLLPVDFVVTEKLDNNAQTKIVTADQGIPPGHEGADIGPKSIELFTNELKNARTILWNGPVGVFEIPLFAKGTNAIAKSLSEMKSVRIIGGGDSVSAIQNAGLGDKFTHLSTGGGASLEYIEFGTLPGIEALNKENKTNK